MECLDDNTLVGLGIMSITVIVLFILGLISTFATGYYFGKTRRINSEQHS